MKRLPCDFCKSTKGEHLLIGRIPSTPIFYKCLSCKRVSRKTPVQIGMLPEASGPDVEAYLQKVAEA